MAKHTGKGRKRSYVRKLKVSETVPLGALTSGGIVAQIFDDVASEKMFLLSIEATYGLAEGAGDQGPIAIGVAHSDYTGAEILEWFQSTSGWDLGDKIAQEQQRRKIRQVGTFRGDKPNEVLNDGRMFKTPLRFVIETGQSLQQWAINQDASTLTTGSLFQIDGQVWAKNA